MQQSGRLFSFFIESISNFSTKACEDKKNWNKGRLLDEPLNLPKSVKLQIECKNLIFSQKIKQNEQLVPRKINPFLTYQFTVQYYYAAKPVGEKVKILNSVLINYFILFSD